MLCDILHLEGAEALAVYGEDFYQGTPAVTCNQFGQGRVYYAATQLAPEGLDKLLDEAARAAKVSPVAAPCSGLEIVRRRNEDHVFTFVMNLTKEAHVLPDEFAGRADLLTGKTADPDITAMAVQALAPYYNSGKSYTYQLKSEKKQVSRTVKQVINEALSCLSLLQTEDGDFMSWGTQNAESTAQVAVALCSLNIDPQKDSRFIKNGKTLLDGILKYRMSDGGFTHTYAYDKDNPSSKPGKSNSMAGEQVLYALAAVIRQQRGQSSLYDFGRYTAVKSADKAPEADNKTAASAVESDKKPTATDSKTPHNDGKTAEDRPEDTPILYFSASDREAADKLPSRLTTEQYVTVITLLEKLEQCEDFDKKTEYLKKLNAAKAEIAALQAEIDSINSDIKKKLYPFDKMGISDKKTVDGIVKRYNALSEYDRQKIERWEDVIKTKTRIDNMLRGIIIAAALCVIAAVISLLLIRRIKMRRRKKEAEMEELASLYNDE